MSQEQIEGAMQKSAKGALVELWNRGTGDTKTVAPQKVLELLHKRIKALGVDLDKQYNNQVTGGNQEINSNPDTNPLQPTQNNAANGPVIRYVRDANGKLVRQ
jgi:hypothetical protein